MGRPDKKETLCWECRRAGGDCSWSHHGEPVEGWLARETAIRNSPTTSLVSYEVLCCPMFVPETRHRYRRLDPDGVKALAVAVLWRAVKDRKHRLAKAKEPGDHSRLLKSLRKLERVFREDSLWVQLSGYGPDLFERIKKGNPQ